MKNYVILFMMVLLTACSERNTTSTTSTIPEKNLQAAEEINNAIKTGDVSKLDQYIAADAVDHASPFGDVRGIDSIKTMLAKIHTMGTNMNMEIIKRMADDEYVFEWMRLTGTTATADWGMPVGTHYDINAVQVSRYQNGKVVEHWEFMQPADMARMVDSNIPALADSTVIATDSVW